MTTEIVGGLTESWYSTLREISPYEEYQNKKEFIRYLQDQVNKITGGYG